MKITCSTCGTPYEVDDSRIPPGGLTMKCTQCHSPLQVRPAGGGGGGPSRFYLRRRTGKVFGPFVVRAIASMLEQGKLDGDEQVSPDGESWMPMSMVPELAAFASDGGAPPQDDLADLPAPKREVPDLPGFPQPPSPPPPQAAPQDDPWADLPAPKAPVVPPPPGITPPAAPPPQQPGGFDLGDFDHAPSGGVRELDFGDDADLPAPKAPVVPPPPGFSSGADWGDLPAPKQPAPPPAAPPPPTGMEYGQLDLGGDDDGLDLPAPKQDGVTGLPAPKAGAAPPAVPPPPGFSPAGGEIADLPAPKQQGVTDLPAPKHGGADLPAPKQDGVTDLPGPRAGLDYGQLDLGGEAPDLLEPAAGQGGGLELDSDFDLPAPKDDISVESDLDSPDLVQPKREDLQSPDFFGDALDGGESVDVVAPKPDMEPDIGPGLQPAPPASFPAPGAGVSPMDEEEVITRPSLLKRKLLMGSVAAGAFILVVGIALGLLTPYGFFGVGLLTGAYSDTKQGEELVKSGTKNLREDTFKSYDIAATEFGQAVSKLPEPTAATALQLEALSASLVRFGKLPAKRSQAAPLAQQLTQLEQPGPQALKALALWGLARGRTQEAIKQLGTISGNEPGDAQAAVYLGWAQLAAERAKDAKATFSRAVSADEGHAGALFGVARAEDSLGNHKAALPWLDKTLQASPNHPGALLLKAKILLDADKKKEAEQVLGQAARARGLASRLEVSLLHTRTAHLLRLKGQANAARDEYQKALKLLPQNAEAHIGLGKLYFSSRKLKDALEQFQKGQAAAPKNLDAAVGAARCYIRLDQPLKAQKVLQRLRQFHPKAAAIPFLLGQVEASVNNLEAAEKSFRAAIKQAPTYFEPYQHLSLVYVKRNKVQQALDLLTEATKQMPGSPRVRDAEGLVHLATGDLPAARAKFEEALRLDPSYNEANFHLGSTLMQQGQLEKAKEHLLAVHKKDASFPGLAEQLGKLYLKLENYKEAAQAYDRALDVDNPQLDTRLGAAKAFNLAGQYDKALKQTEEVLQTQPTESRARALRAQARLGQGKLDDALVEIRQAVDRDKRAEYLVIMGQVHAARREIADAIDAYRDALKLDPKRLDVRFERAKLLAKGGAVRDAIKELKKVLKAQPGNAEAHLYMGIALAESGKESRAIASYRAAAAKDPSLGEAYYRMGQILFDTRKLPPALAAMQKAVEHAKESDPWRADALYTLGVVAQMQGNKKLAIESLQAYRKAARPGAVLLRDALKRLRKLGVRPKREE